ncbi:MAG TPA: hypothetical protein VNE83_00215 [Terriglobales bacterium]|nr:hypothetical protein [Terriglobales bacterium]
MQTLPQCLWTSLSQFNWAPTDSGLVPLGRVELGGGGSGGGGGAGSGLN